MWLYAGWLSLETCRNMMDEIKLVVCSECFKCFVDVLHVMYGIKMS